LRGHVGSRVSKKTGKKSWYIKYDALSGERKQVWKGGFKTEHDAEAALTKVLASIDIGEYTQPSKTSLLTYLRAWLDTKAPGMARQTTAGYRNIIEKHIANDIIGSAPVSHLRPNHLEAYYTRLRTANLKEYTVQHHHRLLHQSLKRAVRDRLLTRNPADDVELQKIRRFKAATYTAEMVAKMLECLRDEDIYPPTLLAVTGGLRRGEDLGATWQAVDLELGTLNINQAYYVVDGVASFDPVKSEDSEDVVYLPAFTVNELKRIRKEQLKQKLQLGATWQDNDLICCKADGSPWNPSTVSKKFSNALIRYGLPHIRFHDLRHTHATVLHEGGADMKDISDRLRHSTVQITSDIYTDMTASRRQKVADVFDKAVFGPKKLPRHNRGNQR